MFKSKYTRPLTLHAKADSLANQTNRCRFQIYFRFLCVFKISLEVFNGSIIYKVTRDNQGSILVERVSQSFKKRKANKRAVKNELSGKKETYTCLYIVHQSELSGGSGWKIMKIEKHEVFFAKFAANSYH